MASFVVQLLPQLKVNTCCTNTQSCSGTDLSRPSCARSEASRSGEAFNPAMISTGSPPKQFEQEEDEQNHPQQGGKHCQMRRRM